MRFSLKRPAAMNIVLLALLAVCSVSLLLLPALFGASSSFDSVFVAGWLVMMVFLLIDFWRRDRKRKRYMRTFYIDIEGRRAFGPSCGMLSYRCGCDLLDAMTVSLSVDQEEVRSDYPDDFEPSLVVETSTFSCVFDERIRDGRPVLEADEVTVTRWEGRIVSLESNRSKDFDSPLDLEDVFCPGGINRMDGLEGYRWEAECVRTAQ